MSYFFRTTCVTVVSAAVLSLAPSLVWAQTPPVAGETALPVAAVVPGVVPVSPAVVPPVATATPTEVERRIEVARRYFTRLNYEGALAEYTRVYEIFTAVGDPRRFDALYEQARCLQRMNRFEQAVERYQRYLSEAGPSATNSDAVTQVITLLRAQLGTLTVSSVVRRSTLWIAGRNVGTLPQTVLLPSGDLEIEVRAPDAVPTRQRVSIVSQRTTELVVNPVPIRARRGLAPGLFIASTSAAGASLIATVIVGTVYAIERGRLLSLQSSAQLDMTLLPPLEQRCPVGVTDRADCYQPRSPMGVWDEENRAAVRLATATNVLAITTGVLTIGASVLGTLTDFRSGGRLQPVVALSVTPERRVLSVGSAF